MSRWAYDTATPPPQAWEAVDKAQELLVASGLMVSGTLLLASTAHVYAHEEPDPTSKPDRFVVVSEFQELGGHEVESSGLRTVRLHVKVVSEEHMTNKRQWHGAMHARISRALTGEPDIYDSGESDLTRSTIGWPYRQHTEPSRPEWYEDTSTWESFAFYQVTLEPLAA